MCQRMLAYSMARARRDIMRMMAEVVSLRCNFTLNDEGRGLTECPHCSHILGFGFELGGDHCKADHDSKMDTSSHTFYNS